MEIKKRNPIISLLLSIIAPGLGQIYNGQLKKGIFLYFIGLLILLTFSITGLYFYGLIISLLIGICWFLFVIADSLITAIKIKRIELNNYNRWYIYLIFILIFNIIGFGSKNFLVMIKAYSIPSATMQHTLLVGDCILVNNAAYGVRNPLTNKVWIPIGKPQRGDVVVFIFPQDPTKDYIKRIAGLPGDRIQIVNKKVLVNGKLFEPPGTVYDDPTIIPAPRGPVNRPGTIWARWKCRPTHISYWETTGTTVTTAGFGALCPSILSAVRHCMFIFPGARRIQGYVGNALARP